MTYAALIVDDEPLARRRIRDLLEPHADFVVVGECAKGEAAVERAVEERPDVLFLDVQMPGFSGFDVAEALLGVFEADCLPLIVFVTAHDAYALRAFDAAAFDYVVKPVGKSRFERTLDRLRTVFAQRGRSIAQLDSDTAERVGKVLEQVATERAAGERFAVRRGDTVLFVGADEIEWIDAAENYVRLHARGGAFMLRSTMNAFLKRLDPAQFLRIHRSAIVNLRSVTKAQLAEHGEFIVTMRDGTRLMVSRTFGPRLRSRLRAAGGRR